MPAPLAATLVVSPGRGTRIGQNTPKTSTPSGIQQQQTDQQDFAGALSTAREQSRVRRTSDHVQARPAEQSKKADTKKADSKKAEPETKPNERVCKVKRPKEPSREEQVDASTEPAATDEPIATDSGSDAPETLPVAADVADEPAIEDALPQVTDEPEPTATAETDPALMLAAWVDPSLATAKAPADEPLLAEGDVAEDAEPSQQPTLAQRVALLGAAGAVDDDTEPMEQDVEDELGGDATASAIELDPTDWETRPDDSDQLPPDLLADAETMTAAVAGRSVAQRGQVQPPDDAPDAETGLPQVPGLAAEQLETSDAQTQSQPDLDQPPAQEMVDITSKAAAPASTASEPAAFDDALQQAAGDDVQPVATQAKPATDTPAADKPARPPITERAFANENHERIVTNVRTQLLPNGGSMQIRLNPDNLGALNITVRVVDGVVSAAFQTSSEEATKLVSHTLGQLKSALETQGVSVDKIQVQQAPREVQSGGGDDGQSQQNPRDNSEHRQQQQESLRQQQERRQLLDRMWRHLAAGGDPLDLVA